VCVCVYICGFMMSTVPLCFIINLLSKHNHVYFTVNCNERWGGGGGGGGGGEC
jgi:hypothetical protein